MATKEQVEVFISTLSKLAINEYTTRKKNVHKRTNTTYTDDGRQSTEQTNKIANLP